MALLIQALILLSAPHLTSWDMTHSARLDQISPDVAIHEVARVKREASNQQQRIEQMGVNGVIYFDAPPSTSRQRILR